MVRLYFFLNKRMFLSTAATFKSDAEQNDSMRGGMAELLGQIGTVKFPKNGTFWIKCCGHDTSK